MLLDLPELFSEKFIFKNEIVMDYLFISTIMPGIS